MSTFALSRRRPSLWGVLAVAVAAMTGLSLYSYLSYLRSQVPIAGRLVPMVVAATDIAPGTAIGPGMVHLVDHPGKYLPQGAFETTSKVQGQIAAVPIFTGEPVTQRKLGRSGGYSSTVPGGMRAFSLVLPVGSGLEVPPQQGDRVDVIVTYPEEVLGAATAMTVLRHKEVAFVARAKIPQSAGPPTGRLGIENPSGDGIAVTIYVTPVEAQKLAMAQSLGKVTVVLAPSTPPEEPVPGPISPAEVGAG